MTLFRVSLLVGLLVVPAAALGQTNPPPFVEGTAEAAYVGVSGNSNGNTFSLGGELIVRPEAWTIKNRVAFVRNEQSNIVKALSFLYSPRVELTISPRASTFGEYIFFRDKFAGVANRQSATLGFSLKIKTSARQTLALDLGAGYLREIRVTAARVANGVITFGSAYKLKLSSTAELIDDFKVLASATKAEDWRVFHGISVSARLANPLSLKVSNVVRYTHFPAAGFKRTDVTTSVALVAKFGQKKK